MAINPAQRPYQPKSVGSSIDKLGALKPLEQVPPIPSQQLQQMGQIPPPMLPPPEEKVSLNNGLKQASKYLAKDLLERALSENTKVNMEREKVEQEVLASLQAIALQNNNPMKYIGEASVNPEMAAASGGLIALAEGGNFSGQVPGEGHGMEDNVYMPIKEGKEQVATLAVSPSEYVVDSYTMAALGNGNTDEGADVMDEAVKQIRKKAYGSEKQPNEINGLAALKPLIERV